MANPSVDFYLSGRASATASFTLDDAGGRQAFRRSACPSIRRTSQIFHGELPMNSHRHASTGFVMLEVLVTIVILVFGLLGLAGFQMRTSIAEQEAYQRVQALLLVQDMTERIYANRANAAAYVQNVVPSAGVVVDCAALGGKNKDVCEWQNSLGRSVPRC
jgi:type II secretory pathway pseudopilin PulG